MRKLAGLLASIVALAVFATSGFGQDGIIVSTADQELVLLQRGRVLVRYPVSTSKFGSAMRLEVIARPSASYMRAPSWATDCPPAL